MAFFPAMVSKASDHQHQQFGHLPQQRYVPAPLPLAHGRALSDPQHHHSYQQLSAAAAAAPGAAPVHPAVAPTPAAIDSLLAEWVALQQRTCDAQLRILRELLDARGGAPAPEPAPAPAAPGRANGYGAEEPPQVEGRAASSRELGVEERHAMLEVNGQRAVSWNRGYIEADSQQNDDQVINVWKRGSGMHTVEDWAADYDKHPAGWGALLMIHGVPEVTGRLRSKVENFAIYSALFLSFSIGLLVNPPDAMTEVCDAMEGHLHWACVFEKRLYFYSLAVGTATHMLSILLAMSFVNVLNEAARDSDVIRMFARGQGFVATVKCQRAFFTGCFADFVAMVVAARAQVGWDILLVAALGTAAVFGVHWRTASLLEKNASIIGYWRESLGGQPDDDDPYELDVPLACLQRRAKAARGL